MCLPSQDQAFLVQRHVPTVSLPLLADHFKSLFYHPGPACQLPCGPDHERSLCQFQSVLKLEIKEILSNLVSNKSPGPGGIRPFKIRLVARKISGTLAILFNESLATGEIPLDFKVGHNIPLLKRGKKDNTVPAHYHSITLNNILSKVLEKVVLKQIIKLLKEHQI